MTCWKLDVQDVLTRVLVVVIHLAIPHVAIAPQVLHVLLVVVLVVVDAVRLVLVHQNLHLVRDVLQVVLVDVIQDVLVPVAQDAVESVQKHVQVIANMAA